MHFYHELTRVAPNWPKWCSDAKVWLYCSVFVVMTVNRTRRIPSTVLLQWLWVKKSLPARGGWIRKTQSIQSLWPRSVNDEATRVVAEWLRGGNMNLLLAATENKKSLWNIWQLVDFAVAQVIVWPLNLSIIIIKGEDLNSISCFNWEDFSWVWAKTLNI